MVNMQKVSSDKHFTEFFLIFNGGAVPNKSRKE